MSVTDHKELARRAIVLWSSGNTDRPEEIFAPDYINHQFHHPDNANDIRGLGPWKQFIGNFHQAFPDFADKITAQIAEGDLAATHFISSGTHEGEIMGVAPTGKRATWTGIAIDRIARRQDRRGLGQLGHVWNAPAIGRH
jgi:predicted ester cyclase